MPPAAPPALADSLGALAHDLRTPIHRVLGFAKLMLEDFDSIEPAQLRHFIERVLESGERLQAMVDELIELAALENGRVRLEPAVFDLGAAVAEVAAEFEPALRAQGTSLRRQLADDAWIDADPARVRQCLRWLFQQMLAHPLARPALSLRLQRSGNHWQVELDNPDARLAEPELEHLFLRPATGKHAAASPLAALLCRGYAERQGGRCAAQRMPGGGLRLLLELPAKAG